MRVTDKTSNEPTNHPLEITHQKHIPSLDGLRGISIILVVMSHLKLSWNYFYTMIFNGPLGVNVFFVISGFLITSLCLKEKQLTGTISLKDFYIRRVLRIFPVAYLYIAVVFVLDHFFHLEIPYFQYLGALLYITNFSYFRAHQGTIQLGHYWSLSIEEQFYIIFPFFLKKNTKIFYWAVLFIVIVLPVICGLQALIQSLNHGVFYYFTHYLIKFQSIATGCLLSMLIFQKGIKYQWLLPYKVVGNLLAILIIFYLRYDPFYTITTVYINLIIALLIAYIIASNIVPGNDLIYRFLNSKTLSFIGKLSYSIYIWQQLFIFYDPRLPAFMTTYPGNLFFVIVVPCVSYFAYERYFLKLKAHFSKIKGGLYRTPVLV